MRLGGGKRPWASDVFELRGNDDGIGLAWQLQVTELPNKPTRLIFVYGEANPHCKLAVVKALVEAGKVRTTHAARAGANELGFDLADMLAVVMALTPSDFYKSMTTHADHTVWQDVYRPSTPAGDVYLKLTVIDDVLIVSFKEL